MATPAPDDFAGSGWFIVKLDGSPIAEESYFREVKGLDIDVTPDIQDEGGKNDGPMKLPQPAKFSNIVLKRGVSKSTSFLQWITQSVNVTPKNFKRVSGTISLRTRDSKAVMEWKFSNAWACRYAGPSLNAETHELAFEEIEIAHEGLQVQAVGGDGASA